MTQVSGPLFAVHIAHQVDRDANRVRFRTTPSTLLESSQKLPPPTTGYVGYGVYFLVGRVVMVGFKSFSRLAQDAKMRNMAAWL